MVPDKRIYEADEIRAADDSMMVAGHAAVFNSMSEEIMGFREKIAPGAFSDSLEADDIRALWQHDTTQPIGRKKAGTLRLHEDDRGLAVEIDLPDSSLGQMVRESIRRGDVSNMSFGFQVIKDSWEGRGSDDRVRTLEEVRLFEVSPVTFPAYPDTEIAQRDLNSAEESWQRYIDEQVRARREFLNDVSFRLARINLRGL